MAAVGLIISILALAVSLAVAAVEWWVRFRARPNIWPTARWEYTHPDMKPARLQVVLVNTGLRQGVVTDLLLRDADNAGEPDSMWVVDFGDDAFPQVLPPYGASRIFGFPVAASPPGVGARLEAGEIKLEIGVVEASRGQRELLAATVFHPAPQIL